MKSNTKQRSRLLSLLLSLVMVVSLLPTAALAQTTDQVTISFDPNSASGGSGTMASVTVDKGSEFTLPECGFLPPKDNVFDGWLSPDLELLGDPGQRIIADQDMMLQPSWLRPDRLSPTMLTFNLRMPQAGDVVTTPEGKLQLPFQVRDNQGSGLLVRDQSWTACTADGTPSAPLGTVTGDELMLLRVQLTSVHHLCRVTEIRLRFGTLGQADLQAGNHTDAMPTAPGQWTIRLEEDGVTHSLYVMLQPGVLPETIPLEPDVGFLYHTPNGGSGYMYPGVKPFRTRYEMPACPFTPPEGMVFEGWSFGGQLLPEGLIIDYGNGNLEFVAQWKAAPHTHDFDMEWSSDDSQHWHECSCGEKADVADHTLEWVIDREPAAGQAGSKHQQCTICGHKLPAVEIPALPGPHEHDFDSQWHTDKSQHWHECSCGKKSDVGYHDFVWVTDREPDVGQPGWRHQVCSICGYALTGMEIPALPAPHEHHYSDEWSYDEAQHWHECSCGMGTDVAPHEYTTVVDRQPTVDQPGLAHAECVVCGFCRPAYEVPALEETTYRLVYNLGKGSTTFLPPDEVTSTDKRMTMEVTSTIPSRPGKYFHGWATSKMGGLEYLSGEHVLLTKAKPECQLYAVWGSKPLTFLYKLDYRGMGMPKDTVLRSESRFATLTVTDEIPTKKGKVFLGWSPEPNDTVVYCRPGDRLDMSYHHPVHQLYPVWADATTYKLDYRGMGMPKDTVIQSVRDEETLTITQQIPRKKGKTFLGWATKSGRTAPEFMPGDYIAMDADNPVLRLYPVWE